MILILIAEALFYFLLGLVVLQSLWPSSGLHSSVPSWMCDEVDEETKVCTISSPLHLAALLCVLLLWSLILRRALQWVVDEVLMPYP
jgi:hypothetical protein